MCKNRLTSLKLCVSSFLFGFQADMWPFNEFYGNQFALSNGKDYRKSKPVPIKPIFYGHLKIIRAWAPCTQFKKILKSLDQGTIN